MEMSTKRIIQLVIGAIALIIGIICSSQITETVGADEIVVKQNAIDGKLQVWSSPGVYWQNFGRVTRYKKSAQYWFSIDTTEGKTNKDESIKVRFNDGGHGNVSGSLRFDMPLSYDHIVKIHSTYGSMEAIEQQLVRQVVNKAVYMSGPLMSSKESYAERRSDLINYITDQVSNGVYRTTTEEVKTKDLITGTDKIVQVVKLVKDPNAPNGFARQERGAMEEFGVRAFNITINSISYSPEVEAQIKQQQEATMSVQTAMAEAKKAEQGAITVAKQGEAEAAKAKWAQEVEKAKAVTIAEQHKAVAALDLETAKLRKQTDITTAEGQAEAKKLLMAADGNLSVKLQAWVDVNKAYAAEIGKQPWVPHIVMGGGFTGGAAGGAAGMSDFMSLLQLKTAKDLAVDLGIGMAYKK